MKDVTNQLKQGSVALFSATTATLFPKKTRVFKTGFECDNSWQLILTPASGLPEGVALFGPTTDTHEIAVVLVNNGTVPVLIEEGLPLAQASFQQPSVREITVKTEIAFQAGTDPAPAEEPDEEPVSTDTDLLDLPDDGFLDGSE